MFNPFRPEDPALDAAIADAFKSLEHLDAADPEYQKILSQITNLYALKRQPVDIDPNKLAAVAGNILVAIVVIKFERTNIITTKVGTFLSKL